MMVKVNAKDLKKIFCSPNINAEGGTLWYERGYRLHGLQPQHQYLGPTRPKSGPDILTSTLPCFLLKSFRSNRSSKKRRRVPTMNQRRAANIRERRRMFNLNEAFDRLRTKVRNQDP